MLDTITTEHLFIAFILGGLLLGGGSSCGISGGGGYQPRKPAHKPDMKLNDFLANAKPKRGNLDCNLFEISKPLLNLAIVFSSLLLTSLTIDLAA